MHIAASREFRKSLSPSRGAWNEKRERAQFFIPDPSQTFHHLASQTDFAISHIDTHVAALMMSSLQIVIDENYVMDRENEVIKRIFYFWAQMKEKNFNLNKLFNSASLAVNEGPLNWPIMVHVLTDR